MVNDFVILGPADDPAGISSRADAAAFALIAESESPFVVLTEGDPILFNPYGVIPVNPATHPDVNAALAQSFAEWLTALDTQQMIAKYKVNEQALFIPDSEAWRAAMKDMEPEVTPEVALELTPDNAD